MHYTRIATYDIVKGDFTELTGIVERGFLPTFEMEPGFVNYGLVDAGNHKVVSISIWETLEMAQRSDAVSGTWVRENVSDRVRLLTTTIGELALFKGAPVTA